MAGVKFRRQYSIEKYVLDFYCPEYRIAIEADGGQHFEKEGLQKDQERTKRLESLNVRMMRFTNQEILTNIEGVYEVILRAVDEIRDKTPSPQSSPLGERKKE